MRYLLRLYVGIVFVIYGIILFSSKGLIFLAGYKQAENRFNKKRVSKAIAPVFFFIGLQIIIFFLIDRLQFGDYKNIENILEAVEMICVVTLVILVNVCPYFRNNKENDDKDENR